MPPIQYKQEPNVRVEPYPPLGEAFFQKLSMFRKGDIGSMKPIRMFHSPILYLLFFALSHLGLLLSVGCLYIDIGGKAFLERVYFAIFYLKMYCWNIVYTMTNAS